MKPNFIGIGAQKCASSWLYDILADHPQVGLSAKKELDFFTHHYDNGHAWYESHFPRAPGIEVVGEISPSYFHEASAAARARTFRPDARILVSLRDPVERALSQHRHLVRIGVLSGPDFTFESGLAHNPSYLEQGLYATHLRRWLDHFPAEQVLVVLMDDIRADAAAVAATVYRFLGIAPGHRPAALHEKSNPSYVVRNRLMDRGVKSLRNGARRLGLQPLWKRLGDSGLRAIYRSYNRRPSQAVIPEPQPETLASLRSRFLPEVDALERLLARDLSAWKRP